MGDVIKFDNKFRPAKISDLPESQRLRVFTCTCGCQVFTIYEVGNVRCIACDAEFPTVEIF